MSSPSLCSVLGKMGDDPVESWKKQIQQYSDNNYFKDLNRIDGTTHGSQMEDFPRTHHDGNLQSDSTEDGRITV